MASKYAEFSNYNTSNEEEIKLAEIQVVVPKLGQYAEELYTNDRDARDAAFRGKLPRGETIDYVLVYTTPNISTPDYHEICNILPTFADSHSKPAIRQAKQRACFESQLRAKGFIVEPEVNEDHVTHYIKLHAPFELLCFIAEKLRIRMPLATKQGKLKDCHQNVFERLFHMPEFIKNIVASGLPDDEEITSAPFKKDHLTKFLHHEDAEGFFSSSQRTLFVYEELNRTHFGNQRSQCGIGKLIKSGAYTAAFPLHDGHYDPDRVEDYQGLRNRLWTRWARFGKWHKHQPLDAIRAYFGFYFAWLGFYTTWLILPALVGLITFIDGVAKRTDLTDSRDICSSDIVMCPLCQTCTDWDLSSICIPYEIGRIFDSNASVAFGVIMSLWGSFFIDFWKRKSHSLAYDWEVLELENEEEDRPEFVPTAVEKDEITDMPTNVFPAWRKQIRYMGTFSFVLFMIFLVIIIVIAVIVYRLAVNISLAKLSSKNAGTITTFTAAIINLIGISLLNWVYGLVAEKMNDWENHRKQTDYDDALTFKYFIFSFVNSYTSIFYIAFFKGKFDGYPNHYNYLFGFRQDDCAPYGCMLELTIQLGIVMVGKQAANNLLEVFIPAFITWQRRNKAKKTGDKVKLPWEREFKELVNVPARGLFPEYLEMVIQFGFITLFVTAFPIGPLFALINNIFEIRIDSNKYITEYRRPVSFRAQDIGVWESLWQHFLGFRFDFLEEIIDSMSVVAVITNGAVIAFTSDFVTRAVWVANNGSLQGYVNATHPLAPDNLNCSFDNLVLNFMTQSLDRYTSTRDPVTAAKGDFFYQTVMAKLAFLIVFEHVVFALKAIIQFLIPDVPHVVQVAIKRQEFQARRALESQFEGEPQPEDQDFRRVVVDFPEHNNHDSSI